MLYVFLIFLTVVLIFLFPKNKETNKNNPTRDITDGNLEKEKIELEVDDINTLTADEELEKNSTHHKPKIVKNSIYDFVWMKKDDLFDQNDLDSIDLLSSKINQLKLPIRQNTKVKFDEKALLYILRINNHRRDSFRDLKFVAGF